MLLADLRYAARTLKRSPVFTAAAVLTMALAIGANTAIFSVLNAVLIRPLPFESPDRLMQVAEKNDKLGIPNFGASVLNYLSWKELNRSFESLGAVGFGAFTLTGSGDPEQITGATISPSLMPLLGIRPTLGRGFQPDEERPGADRVALISQALWIRRFAGQRSAVGSQITLNGQTYAIVGIAPPGLPFLTAGDIWTPLIIDPAREIRLNHVITVFGRLRRGVSLRQAQDDMGVVARRVGEQNPEVRDWGIQLIDFEQTIVAPNLRLALFILLGAVGFVLLIGCANVANLLLSRASARQREIAIRASLGAGRSRLLTQLLTESSVLSVAGGVLGVTTAALSIRLANPNLPQGLLPVPEIHLDSSVLLFAVAITLATGLLFGFAPAWHASSSDLNTALRKAGRSSVGDERLIVRHGLVAGELAIATILLVGAGLLIQSLVRLQNVAVGFHPDGILSFQLAPSTLRYPDQARRWALFRRVQESLSTIPGVSAAAMSSGIPMGQGNYTRSPFVPVGSKVLPPDAAVPLDWRIASPGYFRLMGIPLLAGREFTEHDTPDQPEAIVLSRAAAKRLWGDENPIGKKVHRPTVSQMYTVVGVVGDVRHTSLNSEFPCLYFSAATRLAGTMDIVVQTQGGAESVRNPVRARIHDIDPELPLSNVRSVADYVYNNAAQPRLNAALIGIFAAVALLIASIGVYGVLSYAVSRRTREIGLRMALGARPGTILWRVAGQGMVVSLAGIGFGLAGAFALSRVLKSILFEVQPGDIATFGVVAFLLTTISLAASLGPARRAARVDPIVALREE
ncbi:MAG TPA: ABC transporter permease [Bryobacteraceae bacterium]|nr:ABC transporter permease [Bryobacteraceae bacterium]